MSYGELITTALGITWRNRYLWFFGLFAGGGASFNVPAPGGNFNFDDFERARGGLVPAAEAAPLAQGGSLETSVVVALVAIGLVVLLVLLALSLISQGALVDSVAAIDAGGQRRFGTAWRAGTRSFWRVLGWAALLVAIVLLVLIVVGAPLAGLVVGVFSATESLGPRIAVGVIAGLLAVAVLLLLFVPFAIVAQLGLRELLLRGERPVASLRGGYRLFRANLGRGLLVWLIDLALGLGAVIALVLAALIVGLILFLPTIALAIAQQSAAAIATGVVAGLILLALLLTALGALGTFRHALWTLAWRRLQVAGEG